MTEEKSCNNCLNVVKYTDDKGVQHLSCDEYGFNMLGFPANCDPPHDDACNYWTDDPQKANKMKINLIEDQLLHIVQISFTLALYMVIR